MIGKGRPTRQWLIPVDHPPSETLRAAINHSPEVARRVRTRLETEGKIVVAMGAVPAARKARSEAALMNVDLILLTLS